MTRHEYFRLLIAGELEEVLQEPSDFDFIRMLKEQEENRQNGRRRKNTRNYPKGRRKAL